MEAGQVDVSIIEPVVLLLGFNQNCAAAQDGSAS